MGRETEASGTYSTAIGYLTDAVGGTSIAMGRQTLANALYSTAMGYLTTASGEASTAMGYQTTAGGDNSIAMGYLTSASGGSSIAMGRSSSASELYATAMGHETSASGNSSTATGYQTTASGSASTVMGKGTIASDYGSLVIGTYNLSGSTVTVDATLPNIGNTAFVIGNGTNAVKSDAFKVMYNGNATVSNDLTVSGDVVVSSDARLKANIVSLGSTLAKLLLIDGKRYTMKKNGKQKIGVLAQDIQKIFPELVTTDDKDMLAVNYQGLVPVLINALKEQQSEIDELKEMFKELITKQE
jgi:hypothetical protein